MYWGRETFHSCAWDIFSKKKKEKKKEGCMRSISPHAWQLNPGQTLTQTKQMLGMAGNN